MHRDSGPNVTPAFALACLAALLLASAASADEVDAEQARATAAAEAGDYETAAKAATRAVGLARKLRGKNDASVGPLAFEAGTYLLETRSYKRASAAFSIAFKNSQIVNGKASLKGAEPLRMLAIATYRNGETQQARDLHERHIQLIQRATGEDSLRTANALLEAAEVDVRAEDYPPARRRLRQAIRGFKKAGAEAVPKVAGAQLALGMAYFLDSSKPQKNLPEGEKFFRKSIKTYENHYPLGSPRLIELYEEILGNIAGTPMTEKLSAKLDERLAAHRAAAK